MSWRRWSSRRGAPQKWSPRIAECREVCEKLVARRRLLALTVESMLREQDERRWREKWRAVAEREVARVAIERQRQEDEEVERIKPRHGRLCDLFGADLVGAPADLRWRLEAMRAGLTEEADYADWSAVAAGGNGGTTSL